MRVDREDLRDLQLLRDDKAGTTGQAERFVRVLLENLPRAGVNEELHDSPSPHRENLRGAMRRRRF